jgi:hypothetical protein
LAVLQDNGFKTLDQKSKEIVNTLVQECDALRKELSKQLENLATSQKTEHVKMRSFIGGVMEEHKNVQLQKRMAQLSLLEDLRFSTMADRYETVADAHQRTFEWIFQGPQVSRTPWSNFTEWLRTGSGVYRIQGKAGSGKSTLMRFIADHQLTRQNLSLWSPNGTTEVAAFFFWSSGVLEQRSHTGLLRSLLYEILRKRTDLLLNAFPNTLAEKYELALHNLPLNQTSWSLSRLKEAFGRLIAQTSDRLRLCFFIDGLDEYEGDHEDIISLFKSLSSTYVKFCLSSRPWPVFDEESAAGLGLRLQDLTAGDIRQYVQDKLQKDHRMLKLAESKPEEAYKLVTEIINKASGVFLWVKLVVRSLIGGLRGHDSISDLRRRVSELPPDLEPLYQRMLDGIDNFYNEEASRIFQLHRATNDYSGRPFDVQTLETALAIDLDFALESNLGQCNTTAAELALCRERIDLKLKTRCGGLLEVYIKEFDGEVSYLHQTVKDYLERPSVWEKLTSPTKATKFEPMVSLLMTRVLSLKRLTLEPEQRTKDHQRALHRKVAECFDLALRIPASHVSAAGALLDEVDRVIPLKLSQQLSREAYRQAQNSQKSIEEHWLNYTYPTGLQTDFSCLAVEVGLGPYVEMKLTNNPALLNGNQRLPLLAFALAWASNICECPDLEMAKLLVTHGADPNHVYKGHSIWQYTVNFVHRHATSGIQGESRWAWQREIWLSIFTLMLSSGADPNVCCLEDCQAWLRLYEGHSTVIFNTYLRATLNHTAHMSCSCVENQTLNQDIGKQAHKDRHSLMAIVRDTFSDHMPVETAELFRLIEEKRAGQAVRSMQTSQKEKKKKGAKRSQNEIRPFHGSVALFSYKRGTAAHGPEKVHPKLGKAPATIEHTMAFLLLGT